MRHKRRVLPSPIGPVEALDPRILLANFNDLDSIVFSNGLNGSLAIKGTFNPADVVVGGFQYVNGLNRPFYVFANKGPAAVQVSPTPTGINPGALSSLIHLFKPTVTVHSVPGSQLPHVGRR
ncbi:MAG TPA: hypothetical protein VGZ22_29540, partial [Isosphaeraceae bacterium]|nr:hypothetical protein [Isosphaeraceae bacterium]